MSGRLHAEPQIHHQRFVPPAFVEPVEQRCAPLLGHGDAFHRFDQHRLPVRQVVRTRKLLLQQRQGGRCATPAQVAQRQVLEGPFAHLLWAGLVAGTLVGLVKSLPVVPEATANGGGQPINRAGHSVQLDRFELLQEIGGRRQRQQVLEQQFLLRVIAKRQRILEQRPQQRQRPSDGSPPAMSCSISRTMRVR